MRICGINIVATLVAAVAIYAVGALIYGVLIDPAVWMANAGITKEQMDAVGMSRMPYSLVMPLMTAFGLAFLFNWAGVSGLGNGVKWALLVAFASAVPALLYGWVYGVGPLSGTLIDIAHLVIGHSVAGAILASWK
ncbi:MAG: DUF1761 domain-containing protein [Sphingomonadaceae bacterium]|jgi:hypothetical protein